MKTIAALFLFMLPCLPVFAQENTFNVYHPDANALAEIQKAERVAAEQGKFVFLQIGGNWCKWCRKFYQWSNETKSVDSLFKANFIVVHVNYSKENKNEAMLAQLGYPQRFGFPVFVILDSEGKRLHTQNTGYLESEEGYSEEKVTDFLKSWSPAALNPENYNKPAK